MRRAAPLLVAAVLGAWWTWLLVRCVRAPVDDADVWWVAAAGRQMLSSGHVPTVNGFSFVEPDHAWVMHEWLFGPPYAWGLGALGPRFFAFVASAAFATTGAIVVAATAGRARHLAVGCLAAWIALVLFAHPTARPTWVALVLPAAIAALAFRESFGWIAACACVALELLWSNAHGSFPVGIAVLAAGAASSSLDRRRRVATVVAGAAATLVNPYGARLHALVAEYALGMENLSPIVEYAPLWDRRYFAVHSLLATLALAGLALAAVWALLRGTDRPRAVIVLALLPLAVLHARNAPLVAIVASIALVPVLDDLAERIGLAPYAGEAWRPSAGACVAGAASVVAIGGIAFSTVASRAPNTWIGAAMGGPSFLRLASELPDGAHVVTPFRSAGLVLWLAAPRGIRVFYDSRNDCYSAEMRHVGLTLLERAPAEIAAELARRSTTHALVPSPHFADDASRRGYDGALAAAPGWSVRARDGDYAIYERDPSR